jgi:hypothetical protein
VSNHDLGSWWWCVYSGFVSFLALSQPAETFKY